MNRFPFEEIYEKCASFGVNIDKATDEKLRIYALALLEWNEKMNLTAITEPSEVVYKHFYDCILFLKNVEIKQGAKIVDVGTGAGFPGMVLKIVRPDINLTLLDSLNKRLIFLEDVLKRVGLTAELLHSRAEEAGQNKAYRESFDIATARAVAPMNVLCEYCLPLVKKGGMFIAMKGPGMSDELAESGNALKCCGGEKVGIFTETLTGIEERNFCLIKKISQTPTNYPRLGKKISKQPL